jgi:hypothetical protein
MIIEIELLHEMISQLEEYQKSLHLRVHIKRAIVIRMKNFQAQIILITTLV